MGVHKYESKKYFSTWLVMDVTDINETVREQWYEGKVK